MWFPYRESTLFNVRRQENSTKILQFRWWRCTRAQTTLIDRLLARFWLHFGLQNDARSAKKARIGDVVSGKEFGRRKKAGNVEKGRLVYRLRVMYIVEGGARRNAQVELGFELSKDAMRRGTAAPRFGKLSFCHRRHRHPHRRRHHRRRHRHRQRRRRQRRHHRLRHWL